MLKSTITKIGRGTSMMKLFGVVRNFLERYYRGAKNGQFYRPEFADCDIDIWYGLSESERQVVLRMARQDDLTGLEKLLIKIDDEDKDKEKSEKEPESEDDLSFLFK